MGRFILSVIAAVLVVGLLGAIGAGIYNAGVAAGLAQTGTAAGAAAAPYVYGWGFHGGFGFGFLGLLFPILFLFLIFGLVRAAFGWGHHGRGGWGHGGWSNDPRAQAWQSEREHYLADLHRRLHETDAGSGSSSNPTGGGPTEPTR